MAELMSGVCHDAYVAASSRKYCPSSAHARSGSSATWSITVSAPGIMKKPWVPCSAHCS